MYTQRIATILLLLAAPSVVSANLITNGSFEQGATGWTIMTLNPQFNGDFSWTNGSPPGSGSTFFWGGNGGAGYASAGQLIDVTTDAATIDAGLMRMSTSAWFAGYNQSWDYPWVDVYFLDAVDPNATQLGVVNLGGATFYSDTWALDSAIDELVPVGTRALGVVVGATAGQAGDRDGYVDLINLTLTAVPEPSSCVLFVLGGVGLLRARRRNR